MVSLQKGSVSFSEWISDPPKNGTNHGHSEIQATHEWFANLAVAVSLHFKTKRGRATKQTSRPKKKDGAWLSPGGQGFPLGTGRRFSGGFHEAPKTTTSARSWRLRTAPCAAAKAWYTPPWRGDATDAAEEGGGGRAEEETGGGAEGWGLGIGGGG